MSKKVITRIAPSPTGNLHLGTVRTALYNLLFAKSKGGDFYLRLEDTDKERSKDEFTQEIIAGFNDLGISWDLPLGFDEYLHQEIDASGVIRQSLRAKVHQGHIERLISESKAYYCFASPEELDEMRKAQRQQKLPEGYDNRGRNLSPEQIEAYKAEGRKAVVRLNLGDNRDLRWTDHIRGEMSINSSDLGGDPVIMKANGQVLYNFAVVVDDADMQVSHVFRGEDHLTNTAKQIAIYEALGFEVPEFGHLPLIFTTDKQKLSKRKHGDIAGIEKYMREGYLPDALSNYLIATSYTCPSDQEVYDLSHSTQHFDITGMSKSPAIYDIKKLNWYNREYIAKLSYEDLMTKLKPYLEYDLSLFSDADQKALIDAIRGNLDKFEDINENISYFFQDEEIDEKSMKFLIEGNLVLAELKSLLDNDQLDFTNPVQIKETIDELGEKLELKAKKLFWPIRIAISSRTRGPDLGLVAYLLGKEKFTERLDKALAVKAN